MANTLKLYRRGAVGFIDWLDDTLSTKPFFQEIVCLLHLSFLFCREVIAAKALNIFQGVKQLELLICVSKHPWIHA